MLIAWLYSPQAHVFQQKIRFQPCQVLQGTDRTKQPGEHVAMTRETTLLLNHPLDMDAMSEMLPKLLWDMGTSPHTMPAQRLN